MKKVINVTAKTVTFQFDGCEAVTLDMSRVSVENREYAVLHGLAARVGDNAALSKSAANGFAITEAARREAVIELVEHYHSGSVDWNLRTAVRKAPQNPTILAIAAKMGLTYVEAEAEIQRRMLAELA